MLVSHSGNFLNVGGMLKTRRIVGDWRKKHKWKGNVSWCAHSRHERNWRLPLLEHRLRWQFQLPYPESKPGYGDSLSYFTYLRASSFQFNLHLCGSHWWSCKAFILNAWRCRLNPAAKINLFIEIYRLYIFILNTGFQYLPFTVKCCFKAFDPCDTCIRQERSAERQKQKRTHFFLNFCLEAALLKNFGKLLDKYYCHLEEIINTST